MMQEHLCLGSLNREQLEKVMEECQLGIEGKLPGAKSKHYLSWLLRGLRTYHQKLLDEENAEKPGNEEDVSTE